MPRIETRGRKPKGDMTIREQKFLDLWVNKGMSLTDAYMKLYPESNRERAGYKGHKLKEKIKARDGYRMILEAAGIGEAALAKKHKQLLEAKRVVYATEGGQITDVKEFEDGTTQMAALKHANELHGHVISKSSLDVAVHQGRKHWTEVLAESEGPQLEEGDSEGE